MWLGYPCPPCANGVLLCCPRLLFLLPCPPYIMQEDPESNRDDEGQAPVQPCGPFRTRRLYGWLGFSHEFTKRQLLGNIMLESWCGCITPRGRRAGGLNWTASEWAPWTDRVRSGTGSSCHHKEGKLPCIKIDWLPTGAQQLHKDQGWDTRMSHPVPHKLNLSPYALSAMRVICELVHLWLAETLGGCCC